MEQFNNLLQAIEGKDMAVRKECADINEQAARNTLHATNSGKITGLYETLEEA